MGNIGQSVAVFGAPVFYLSAQNDTSTARPRSVTEALAPLRRSATAWILSLFYFLTFGGFVALSLYMPTFLRELFGLSATDAGARTAGFVVVATMPRPLGGMLADKFGGSRVLIFVFIAIAALALFLGSTDIALFTVGALGCAAALGLGNGAVFKLVPEYFPKETGTVTGLVGAFGGLGGFFPPLELGIVKDATGSYFTGFVLLSVFSIICLGVNYFAFLRSQRLTKVVA